MRGSEVLVAATVSLLAACSGTTIGQIGKSDPGRGNRDAGSSGGSASTIGDASMGAVQGSGGSGGGVLVVAPRDAGSDADTCSAVTLAGEYIPIDVLLLVERTPATEEMIPGTTTSWWTATTAGIRSFFGVMSGSSGEVGLKIFPVVDGDGAAACQADYVTPDVGMSSLSGPVTQAIEMQLSARAPAAGRPTGPALGGALSYLRARDAVRLPGHSQAIALITRGEPDMCQPSTLADLERVGVTDGGLSPALVYTIALGASAENMAKLGYGDPELFYIPGGDVEQAVRNALIRIMFLGAGTCSLMVPPTSQAPDFGKIVVTIDPVVGGHYDVPRVLSAADCERNGGKGWYAGTVDAAPSIVLCHTTCADPGEITLLFGCAPSSKP